ncbi:SET and MYND domain-containing protein 4 [Nilaparvata lugens]|uniref:SET and MYND domain-containing protein 4 n=1 Tax=Nilaparvata lugens TaxID=108931 RepID=UPI00193D5302|nr:SET and MYND domain-containing protein 4 [Nilaparvata lugens]XP_039280324.1 SET and MYND domain-containing protein 4 [Nilaparvata lugens]
MGTQLNQSIEYKTSICSAATLQSDRKGFFMTFAENVAETAGKDWIEKFGKLKLDEERIKYVFNDEKIYEAVHSRLQNVQPLSRGKSAQIALSRRSEAHRAIKLKQWDRAVMILSQSIIRAPATGTDNSIDNGLSLAYALWDRSGVLLEQTKFELALSDVRFALKEKLPDSYRPEAYWRMSKCYNGMGSPKQAMVCLNLVSKLTTNDTKWKDLLRNEMDKAKKLQLQAEDDESNVEKTITVIDLPPLLDSENSRLPCLSSFVGLNSSKEEGRFIVAKQPLKSGDVIAVEKPFIAALIPDKYSSHCLHCFRRIVAVVPCRACSGVGFCSEECRDVASKSYHRYECAYVDLLLGSGMSVLCYISLRIFTRAALKDFLSLKSKLGTDDDSHPYLRFYKLVKHDLYRTAADYLNRTLMSLFLLRVLQSSGYFGQKFDPERLSADELYVGTLMLHQLELLQFNAHEIYETVMKAPLEFKSMKLNYAAVGVFISAAMFNHDCYPALARYFNGQTIVLQCTRPILAGEPVTENYGPIYTKKDLTERQQSLQSRYWFQCNCTACKQDWPVYEKSDINLYNIRCSTENCEGCLEASLEVLPKIKERELLKDIPCPACHKSNNILEKLILIHSYEEDHFNAMEAMNAGNLNKAIELLCQYSDDMHKICQPPNKNISLSQEALRTCWAALHGSTHYISNNQNKQAPE